MSQFRNALVGAYLLCVVSHAFAGGLFISGKSAQDAFKDDGVVRLLTAAINRDPEEAKKLIASGINIDATGEGGVTPLLWVELNRDTDAMQLLLDLGADPNKFVLPGIGKPGLGPPAWLAAAAGQNKILQILLDHGADPNVIFGNDTPVMIAISESHLECAELLLKHGADINLSVGYESALIETMTHVQFGDAVWVLNHGFTHDLATARRMLSQNQPRVGQETMRLQALELIDQRLATQKP